MQRLGIQGIPVVDEFRNVHGKSGLRFQVSGIRKTGCSACDLTPAVNLASRFFLFLGRNGQSENRQLPGTRDVHAARIFGTGQVESLAKFAAIDFGIRSPRFLDAAALPFDDIGGVEPALQMSAAEFALFVLLIAGALAGFLDLYFMVGKLRDCRRDSGCDFTGSHLHLLRAFVKAACWYFTQAQPSDQGRTLFVIRYGSMYFTQR